MKSVILREHIRTYPDRLSGIEVLIVLRSLFESGRSLRLLIMGLSKWYLNTYSYLSLHWLVLSCLRRRLAKLRSRASATLSRRDLSLMIRFYLAVLIALTWWRIHYLIVTDRLGLHLILGVSLAPTIAHVAPHLVIPIGNRRAPLLTRDLGDLRHELNCEDSVVRNAVW